jgi:alginate O-acetyltransferase complex protein AlgI
VTFITVAATMIFFRASTMASAIDLVKGVFGLNGFGLSQDLLDRLGPVTAFLYRVGVVAEAGSGQDFIKTGKWICLLLVIALALPNTLQILGRYEPALGVRLSLSNFARGKLRFLAWSPSVPWTIVMSAIAAVAFVSIGGPSEFLYWQF